MNTDEIKIIKYAKVIKIYGRTGLGGVTQVLVRLIDEPKRTLIRNIKGSNCFSYSYSTLRINKNERKRK